MLKLLEIERIKCQYCVMDDHGRDTSIMATSKMAMSKMAMTIMATNRTWTRWQSTRPLRPARITKRVTPRLQHIAMRNNLFVVGRRED